MDKDKIALIGCGRIGFLLESDPLRKKPCTHYGGAVSAGLKINYACDINGERLKKFSALSGIPGENTFTDYKELMRKAKPSLVIIATWTGSHFDIAMEGMKNGARVIVLEKPVSTDLQKAQILIDESIKKNVSLIINHERRYDSRYIKTRALIREGKIGRIKTVHASILTGGFSGAHNMEQGGGPLLHDGTHLVDIIRFFFGEINTVQGEFQRTNRKAGFEDRAAAWLKTEDGTDVFLEAGGNRNYFIFELEISGTEGKIIIGNGYEKIFLKKKSRFYTGFKDLEEKSYPKFKRNNCFTGLYKETKKIMGGKFTPVTSSGLDGLKALEVIHAVYLSSHLGRKKIILPLGGRKINLKKIFNLNK